MSAILSISKLRVKYKDLLNNSELNQVSHWTEPNSDKPTDEIALRKKMKKNLIPLTSKLKEAINSTRV
jgi:hypothetical protein